LKVQIPKTVRKTIISILILVLLFIAGGVAYVWYVDRSTPTITLKNPDKKNSETSVPKPVQPAANAQEGVAVESFDSSVKAGENISFQIRTNATSNCTIVVTYNNGITSKDSGLAPKTADAYGFVTWTWTVEPTVPVGKYPVKATCTYNGRSGVAIGDLVVTN